MRIGAERDWLRIVLFISTGNPEYSDAVTKALLMCFETLVDFEAFVNKVEIKF